VSWVFVDANVPMYASGSAHARREDCRRAIGAIAAEAVYAVTSVEVMQELLHRYLATNRRSHGFRAFDAFRDVMHGRILPVDHLDVRRARELAETYRHLEARDALHTAVMQRHRIGTILSTDRHFDGVEGITRVDPADFRTPA
jgi:predicted nucleic acid-binding protein